MPITPPHRDDHDADGWDGVPRSPGTVVLDSASLGWNDVRVFRVIEPQVCDGLEVFARDHQSIVLIERAAQPAGAANIERRRAGRWLGARYRDGDLGFTAPGEGAMLRWRNRSEHVTVQVRIRARLLEEAADGTGYGMPSRRLNRLSHHDTTTAQLVRALGQAAGQAAPGFYVDAAARFLAAHLVGEPARPRDGAHAVRAHVALDRMDAFLRERLADDFTLAEVAGYVGVGTFQLIRLCRAQHGETPFRRLQRFRIEHARALLQTRGMSVTQIALECGYTSPSAFGNTFLKATGLSPSVYRAL
ncbi:helix-turn-helix domain-containing protein [Luteimonas abyssi]|uniref:helix-turn-helix domain-containing protein n=1 Tax=Luteimonas abyssi TaxID=1247514 RepID=UPI000737C857|nr:AraC family transcriptional regulator [Luteimonas abyssi]